MTTKDLVLHPDHVEMMQKSQVYSRSKLLPKQYRNAPEDCLVAIEIGAELGMSPLGALQSLNVIQGKIAFPAETQMALMIQSKDYHWHTLSSNKEIMETEICVMKGRRKSWPEGVVAETTYSVQEAKDGRLWGSSPSWKNHPADMIRHRCETRFIQTYYPDVTKGIASTEHMEDWQANAPRQFDGAPQQKPNSHIPAVHIPAFKLPEPEADPIPQVAERIIEAEKAEEKKQDDHALPTGEELRERRAKEDAYWAEHRAAADAGRKQRAEEEEKEWAAAQKEQKLKREARAAEDALQEEAKKAGVSLWTKEELEDMLQEKKTPAAIGDLQDKTQPKKRRSLML
jgi:hypothetical protein